MNHSTLPPPSKRAVHPPRNGQTTTKAPLIDMLGSQQLAAKLTKARSAKRSSAPVKQQESRGAEDVAASSPLQKKRPNRSARKALSTGSFVQVRAPKALSQESVVILKRGEASNISPFLAGSFVGSREEATHTEHNDHRAGNAKQTRSRDSSPSRRRNLQPPSKSRRAQRRKDVQAIRDALQNSEADMLLGTSPPPPQPSGSTSSGESSDDVADVAVISGNEKIVTVPKADSKRRRKRERVSSSPATSTSASAFPPLTATTTIERTTVAEETKSSSLRVTFAKSARQTRRGSSPAIEIKHHVAPLVSAPLTSMPTTNGVDNHPKPLPRTPPVSSSAIQSQGKISPLYAGPTFSNSPAPDALPLPSFHSRSLGEPSPLSSASFPTLSPPNTPTSHRIRTTSAASFLVQHQARRSGSDMDEDIFGMDNIAEVYSSAYPQELRARSRDLLGLISPSAAPQSKSVSHLSFVGPHVAMPSVFQGYHLPPKMMASHPPQNGITREMTVSLRTMLKIR